VPNIIRKYRQDRHISDRENYRTTKVVGNISPELFKESSNAWTLKDDMQRFSEN